MAHAASNAQDHASSEPLAIVEDTWAQAARLWKSESESDPGGALLGNGLLVRSADLDEVVAFASAERDRFDQGQPLPYQALGSAISFLRLLNRYSNEFFGPSGDLIPGLGLVWGSLRVIVEAGLKNTETLGAMSRPLNYIAETLARLNSYPDLVQHSDGIRIGMALVYRDVILFVARAAVFYRRGTYRNTDRATLGEYDYENDLEAIENHLQLIEREIAHANTTRFTPIQQATAESDASKLLRWLEPEKDEASHFEFDFAAALKAPTPNTCGWITDGGPVDSWIQDSHSKTLWMTGKPGCGKFVLSVHITGTLNDRHEADFDVAYYSFRHGDIAKRSPTAFLKSVLYQLVSMNETFLQDLWPIYEKSTKDRAKEDSFNELSAALLAMCERSSSLLFVINGLDACHDIPSILAIIQKATNTRLLILSRPSSEIQRCLGNSPFTSLEISKSMVTDAVKMYAGYRIEESDLFLHLNNDVLERLEDAIVEAADGMFLCARLLLDIIFSQPSQPGTEADVDEMIATLPKGLDNIYSIVIDNLEAEVDQIQRIFNWLIVAARPLRLSELGVLLDIGVVRSDAPDPVEQAIRAICGPLVQVFEGSVFLVHPTVKDYLLSGQAAKLSLNVPEANKQATDTCLKYLLLPQFESVGRMRLESVTIRLGSLNMREGQVWESEAVRDLDLSYPLLQYAASFWPKHAVLADASSDALLESVAKFFESPNCMTWVHLYTHEFGYSLNHLFALQSDLQKWLSTREVRPQNLPPISSISDFPRSIRSKAVEINKAKLGVDHTETWIAVYNLAVAEEQAGRLTQAEIGYRQAAASFPRLLGASNVWTLRAQCGIASVHWRRGEVEDALALCTAAVEGLRQLPDSTTDLAYALDQLGTLYAEIEKMRFSGKKTIEVKGSQFQAYNNALKYHEEALELYQKALGPLARRTLEVRNHLAVDRQIGGYRKMASDMYRELVKDATAALGERHPSTLGFRQNLAAAYVDLGMLDEAEEILSSAVDETAEIMGHNDARLFSVLHNRGVLAMKRGQLEQAEADMSKSFSGRVAALGLKHEETLSSLDKLATIVWMQGRLEEAERIHLREKSLQDYLTSARTGADHQRILTRGAIPIPDRTKDTYKSGSMFCVDRKDWDSNGQTPLHWASIKGWSDRVRILCELDNKVNAQGPEQMTPVHCAVMGGSIEVVQYLIQRGHSPSTPDSCGLTPLHHASYLGHIEICRFLVRQDPSLLKAFTNDGSTAFYLAHYNKEKENIGTLVALLESGMNPDVGFGYKIRSRHPEVMAVLELYGSSVIVIDSILESAPHDDVVSLLKAGCGKHLARATNAQLSSDAFRQIKGKMDPSLYGRDIQDMAAPNILAALLAKNADVNERNNPYFGWTPLTWACAKGLTEVADMLLHVGADVNVQSFRKETPLANAIRAGNTELVEILLSKGAEVWTIDNEWMNPLQRAFQCLDLAGIKKLVEAGADPRKSLAQPQLDRRRPSYLQIAAILDRADCIEYLVRDIGIPVNDKNRGGVALHDAIRHANLASFRKLLELGALANAGQDLDTYAITLQCAIDAGLFSMLQEVMAVDVDINAIGKIPIQDSTVLHLAVESGWYAAVKLMLDAGADVSLKRPDGLSLLQLGAKLLVENQSPIENAEGRQHVFSCLLTRAYPEAFRRR